MVYTQVWNGGIGSTPVSITGDAFNSILPVTSTPVPARTAQIPPHRIWVKNIDPAVPVYLGDFYGNSSIALFQTGWKLLPGETFECRLSRDELFVATDPAGPQGSIQFLVTKE